jgi:predicted house-cleaning NTP pyrophosphatase (Maf/HAM1 superfamily)
VSKLQREKEELQMEKEAHEEYARKTLRKFQEKNGSLVVDCNAKLKEKNDETEAMLQDFKAQLKEIIDEKIDAFLQTKKLGDEAPVQIDA